LIQFPTLVTAVIFDSCSGYGADGILSPPTILEFQILLISFQISFEIECHMWWCSLSWINFFLLILLENENKISATDFVDFLRSKTIK
jgi:hypothetical protein